MCLLNLILMMWVHAQSDTEAEALILWPPDTKN